MRRLGCCLLGLCFGLLLMDAATAQEGTTMPKVLQVTREYTKPGKGGMLHDQAESAFVKAMAAAKWPTHYLAMTSLSGKQRALYLSPYATFEAWEKDSAAVGKNSALSAALERASVADGELLDSLDQGVLVYREEMSLRPRPDLSLFRYMEITAFQVRPGRTKEWNELFKMAKAAYEKAIPDAHWSCFQQMYGGNGGIYILFTGLKSLAEVDQALQQEKQFVEAIGEEGMRKLDELFGTAVEYSQSNLFAFNPRMSYVPDEWIKADPEFWKSKPVAAASKPAAAEKKAKP